MTLMKNRSLLKVLFVVLAAGLLTSCMGLKDTDPIEISLPEIQSFSAHSADGYSYELTAVILEDDKSKIVECGFYVSDYKSMQGAEKIVSELSDREFLSEISISEGEQKYVCAYLSLGSDFVEVCSEVKTIVAGVAIGRNISKYGPANCYIVSEAGLFGFEAVRGNSSEPVGDVNSVEVLWESFGTAVTPKVGNLIRTVSYFDGIITFQTPQTFREGNAVIAAKDASGKILWSWHIWLTDAPRECVYANNAGTMMDRNLGATSATPGDVGALGLLYQWGRKDPFLGSSSISESVEPKSTITWPSPVFSSASSGTIAYAVEHPTTFIKRQGDWCYTGSSSADDARWRSTKTIYDPCPTGWRVPDGGEDGIWNKAGFDDCGYDDSDEGMLLGSGISSPATWYPASGYRHMEYGNVGYVANFGIYWSASICSNDRSYCLYFTSYDFEPSHHFLHAFALSVRCQKE